MRKTRFVDTATLARIVNRVGIDAFLAGLAAAVREDFLRWEQFEKSARAASHSDVGVIELMPVADEHRYAFKYVNGHPANAHKGMPTVMAFGAMADVATGFPFLLSELTLTTAFRTAAASLVAAQALARPDCRTMGMIGCGAQAEFQAIAFHNLLGIEEIKIFDIDTAAMQKLTTNLAGYSNLRITSVATAGEATAGVDVVTTCTADKKWATILTPDMISPGMHINGIGGDCPGKTELHIDVLKAASVFVEYEPQSRVEGDIQQLSADHPVTELWEVLAGRMAGRSCAQEITVFDSVGFALEDYSSLRYIHELALQYEEGEDIDLIACPANPKDLFQTLMRKD